MDNALLDYIKEYLIDEVNRTELTEKTCENIVPIIIIFSQNII